MIRYSFIVIFYNFIVGSIMYALDWFNRKVFHWKVDEWTLPTLWFVISVMVLIGGVLLAAAPVINEWLYCNIELKIIKLKEKMRNESNRHRAVSDTVHNG